MVAGTFDFEPYKARGEVISPLGAVFKIDEGQGLFARSLSRWFVGRKAAKKEMKKYKTLAEKETDIIKTQQYTNSMKKYDGTQKSKKIKLNGAFGYLKYKNSPLFCREIAGSYTTTGQVCNRYASDRINKKLNDILGLKDVDLILAGDTDSFYINMQQFVDKVKYRNLTDHQITDYLDNISQRLIEPELKRIYEELAQYMGVYENTMNMDREIIAKGGFWVAKKRYVAYVLDMEGTRFKRPKEKIMGIQIVRSDTPTDIKPHLKKFVKKLTKNENMRKFISQTETLMAEWTPEQLGAPISCNTYDEKYDMSIEGINKFGKGTNAQTKGSIRYNELLRKLKLENKYPLIYNGSKVKFLYLKDNDLRIDSIAWPVESVLPTEFNLHGEIDRKKMIKKIFGSFCKTTLERTGKEHHLMEIGYTLF